MRTILKVAATFFAAAFILVGCGSGGTTNTPPTTTTTHEKNPIVTMTLGNGKKVEIELYPEIAPNTVDNFVTLVQSGFYDGLTFHRIIPGFMIQGGDPDGNGTGGPGYGIPGEFASNAFANALSHEPGVISMARSGHPDSAGSQFFIMVEESPHLDGEYAGFGKVITGMENVMKVVETPTDAGDMPTPGNEQIIKKMTVETFGEEYAEPTKA